MDAIEGKSNASGIRWREPRVEWLGLKLEAIIDYDDPVMLHGLSSHIKYVRIVRRKLNGRNRFYVQLVCEGKPYWKPKHQVGEGVVGQDLGPSTIAAVSPEHAFLDQFCAELEPRWKEIRRLQRKRDRQQRANNPQNYNPNGTIKHGPKVWYKSGRQLRTEAKLAELYRKQAAHRKSLHGQMAYRVLAMGNVFPLEQLSYRAFQRRFGRSVGLRAPGKYLKHFKYKAESAGAWVYEFPTRPTRLSQTCHGCGSIQRKPLSQRWHICDCGIVAQRDLYAAFLATCVEGDRLNADRAREAWSGMDTVLQAAMSRIKQPAKGRPLPSSFGLGQRQSRSPVKASVNASKAQDVVPPSTPMAGELEKARWIARTP
jgi:putative transposase